VIGRIKSLKNSSDSIGNRTHNLPVCSAVPQPTVPLHTPKVCVYYHLNGYNSEVFLMSEALCNSGVGPRLLVNF
jgi:hypothetical protein